ncbi:MAG TPA: YcaO-like family protein [Polyangiaceae bacterium]|nr:YcaO-like family protein [Polyangiaceae bacterium]
MFTTFASQSEAARLFGEWEVVESVSDEVVVDGLSIRRAALTARHLAGGAVTGSAASAAGDPTSRAWGELIERASLVSAHRRGAPVRVAGDPLKLLTFESAFPDADLGDGRRRALSNGVALAADFDSAAERAWSELVERDALLRSWRGETKPEPLDVPTRLLPATRSYEWVARSIASPLDGPSSPRVVAVFGLPLHDRAPLLRGYAARETESEALAAALTEAIQGLAFLWDEPIPDCAPTPEPNPMFHLDHYLWPGSHRALRAWLSGSRGGGAPSTVPIAPTFVDLTPEPLRGRVAVVKAVAHGHVELAFGVGGEGCRGVSPHPIA